MPDAADLLVAARRELAQLPTILDTLVADLDSQSWRSRPAPTEWSPVEILCHLRDEEVEDFRARIKVVVEGGSRFARIDPERWAVERRYGEADPLAALAAVRERRAQSLVFLAAVLPDHLVAAVEHPKIGPLSGLDLLAAWVAHDRLHTAQLTATLARLWANRWMPLRVEYAGPIPYSAASG